MLPVSYRKCRNVSQTSKWGIMVMNNCNKRDVYEIFKTDLALVSHKLKFLNDLKLCAFYYKTLDSITTLSILMFVDIYSYMNTKKFQRCLTNKSVSYWRICFGVFRYDFREIVHNVVNENESFSVTPFFITIILI